MTPEEAIELETLLGKGLIKKELIKLCKAELAKFHALHSVESSDLEEEGPTAEEKGPTVEEEEPTVKVEEPTVEEEEPIEKVELHHGKIDDPKSEGKRTKRATCSRKRK